VTDDRTHAGAALVQLRAKVDAHFAAAARTSGGQMRCGPGCTACCRARPSVLGVEADRIAAALARLDPALRERVRAQADDPARAEWCALLVDGRCSVYDERPLLCRSHGLPLAAVDERGAATVDWCPLNFTEAAPPAAAVLRTDAVLAPLGVLARMWDGRERWVDLAELARTG
jgi:hypothetical protein